MLVPTPWSAATAATFTLSTRSGDVVSETNAAAAGGTDLVNTLVNYTLGANVENWCITASGAVNAPATP